MLSRRKSKNLKTSVEKLQILLQPQTNIFKFLCQSDEFNKYFRNRILISKFLALSLRTANSQLPIAFFLNQLTCLHFYFNICANSQLIYGSQIFKWIF
jgi:hypothetical protein